MNIDIPELNTRINHLENRIEMVENVIDGDEGLMAKINDMEFRIKMAIDAIFNGADDGQHHKQYALDQALRALVGCPLEEVINTDGNGNSYSCHQWNNCKAYQRTVEEHGFVLEDAVPEDADCCVWEFGFP